MEKSGCAAWLIVILFVTILGSGVSGWLIAALVIASISLAFIWMGDIFKSMFK